MTKSVLVYGPQGCGKTHHKDKIVTFFGLTRVVDDLCARRNFEPERGTVYLTCLTPSDFLRAKFDVVIDAASLFAAAGIVARPQYGPMAGQCFPPQVSA